MGIHVHTSTHVQHTHTVGLGLFDIFLTIAHGFELLLTLLPTLGAYAPIRGMHALESVWMNRHQIGRRHVIWHGLLVLALVGQIVLLAIGMSEPSLWYGLLTCVCFCVRLKSLCKTIGDIHVLSRARALM
jgi:hypothetical protein